MSPLAGRRPDDQLSVRRARVPSGTRSALRRAFNPRSSQGSNGRCRICGTLLCAGNIHLSGGVQAGAIGRSWDVATRVKFPQEGGLVAVPQRQHLHQSFRLCRPDLHVGAKWWDLNKSPPEHSPRSLGHPDPRRMPWLILSNRTKRRGTLLSPTGRTWPPRLLGAFTVERCFGAGSACS